MAAGRSGSYRHYEKREFDPKSSSRRKMGDTHHGDDDRLRGPDLRDRLTDRRIRDRDMDHPLHLHNGHHRHHHHHRSSARSDSNSSGGSEHKRSRSRRLVEREPGEVSSGSESPVSEKALLLSSPSKKRKLLSPLTLTRDRSDERKPTFLPPPPPLPNGFVVPPRPIVIAQCSMEQKTCLSEENADTDDAPSVYQRRHDDLEPGEMEEDEEIAPARNISASRWADGDDFDDDEQAVPKAKKKRSPQSGEVVSREGSEGALSGPSSSDGEPPKDGHHKDLEANGNVDMDVDGKEDDNVSDNRLSDTDSESGDSEAQTPEPQETPGPEQPPERGFNMVQGCRSVDEFERMNKINEGTYGVVYRARDKKTNEIVALKKVKMEKEREGFPLTSLREINILLSLQHPYIVGVKEVVVGSSLDSIFMVMEYMDHDLKALMEVMKQPFSQSEVKCLMLQLLEGVAYLHDNWVLHRDLKTSNLLLNNCGELKICDFGLSRQYGSPLKPYTPLVVTLWYRAPELLLGAKEYSTAIDMWSLGCIMAELLAKDSLFKGKTEFDQLDKIFRILGTPNEKIWPGFAKLPGVKVNFVKQPYNKLREKFPPITSFSGRPTLSEAGFDLLNRLLTYDPVKRITAQDALDHPWFREIPLPKSKEFMPTFPAQNAHDRCKRRIMKSPDPLEEQRRKELQRGELGGGGLFG